MTKKYKMYGADFSLYSGKVRSYLIKKNIPYEEVLSTLKVYKKFIVPRTGVRYIPVVQTPEDEVFQDTSVIIDELEKRFPQNSMMPTTPLNKLIALLLEVYGDEWLLIPAMHYRWYFKQDNYQFITQKFGGMLKPRWPKFLQSFLGRKVAARFQGAVQLLGVREYNRKAVEKSYEELLSDLQTHFSQHDYLLGTHPSIADFSFMGPFFAHLYSDPYPGAMMKRDAPAVVAWVERMNRVTPLPDKALKPAEIPKTLLPILKRMLKEHVPVILDTNKQLAVWKDNNPNLAIPSYIGEHSFTIGGVSGLRKIFPYVLWMWQRPVNYYQSLGTEEKQTLDASLNVLGFKEALNAPILNRLTRKGNLLVFSE